MKFSKFFSSLAIFLSLPVLVLAQSGAFSITPANPNAEQPSWLIYEIRPGDSITDEVIVQNLSSETERYELYAVDRQESPSEPADSFALANKGDEMKSIGKWVTLSKNQVTLGPEGKEKISFTLSIPKETPNQEYSGGIVIEKLRDQTAGGTSEQQESEQQIFIGTRVGLRLYAKVTDTPRVILALQEPETTPEKISEEEIAAGDIFTPLNIVLGLVVLGLLLYLIKILLSKRGRK